tara:strand:- start:138 stop:590 length:453 start_codon:yes stop_codon:yes gene_type:complete
MRIAITGAIFCICFFMPQHIAAAKLTINISNQEKPGVLFLTICNSAAGFENSVENESEEDSCRGAVVETELKDVFEIRAEVPDGEYAIAAFLDTNANNKMDKNFIGIPKEQYGFSNNAMGRMSAPSFDQAKFSVEGDTIQDIGLRSGIPK